MSIVQLSLSARISNLFACHSFSCHFLSYFTPFLSVFSFLSRSFVCVLNTEGIVGFFVKFRVCLFNFFPGKLLHYSQFLPPLM